MTSATLAEVAVQPIAPGRFRDQLLNEDAWPALADTFQQARTLLEGRVVWHISSRARSGGLGDLVRSMTALARGGGVDARWEVLDASADFYRLAKRLHNNLHGFNDHSRGYGAADRTLYEATVGARIDLTAVNPGDIVVLHDPQTAGMVPAAKHWEPSGSPYLTDGVNLYRYAGGVPQGTSELIALEDCWSLELLRFSLDELRALGVRSVDPADGEPTAPAARQRPHADDRETLTR